ncbi:transporter [Halorussus ruber]|uniref:transporter n=1 Tax=Halorussus ruber TaxID=1126238 RepID=UPI00109213C1|nr:transporter [Halorussus ruber]
MPTTQDASVRDDGLGLGGLLARGAIGGASAWLVGYLVAYVWKAQAVSESLRGVGFVSELLGGEAIPAWKGVTWLFLNAHFVATRIPTIAGGTRTTNFVTGEGGSTLLLALPALLLVVSGAVAAYGRGGGPLDGAKTGGSVVLGYLPLSTGAAFLTSHAIGDTQAAISPDPVTAILLAGAVYPLVFGSVGGALTEIAE